MESGARARLRPCERLSTASAYRHVFRQGIRLDGPDFLLLAVANARGYSRLGLAAGRRLGGAVARNRAKRLLRESFRRNKARTPPDLDLVLVPKREIVTRTLDEVEREYRERLRRLVTRRPSLRGQSAAPSD